MSLAHCTAEAAEPINRVGLVSQVECQPLIRA
jgi:hypothetical protein